MTGRGGKQTITLAAGVIAWSAIASSMAWGDPTQTAGERPNQSACARATFRILIDVGHTPESPGATSARGVTEYEFNLQLAKEVEHKLIDAGFAHTSLLTVNGPAIRSMYQRVARANQSSADLLLSVHHDAVPDSFLEKWNYEGKQFGFSDRFSGHSIFIANGNADRKTSLLFGHILGDELKARGLQYTHHYTEPFMGRYRRELIDAEAGVYRYDTLFLLKKTRMPAVLLEAGSIVNRDEELMLGTPEYKSVVGTAVTDAVESFCVAQALQKTPRVASQTRKRRLHRHAAQTAAAIQHATFIDR